MEGKEKNMYTQTAIKGGLWDLVWVATEEVNCLIIRIVMVTIYSSGQTIFNFSHIQGTIVGAGGTSVMSVDRFHSRVSGKGRSQG